MQSDRRIAEGLGDVDAIDAAGEEIDGDVGSDVGDAGDTGDDDTDMDKDTAGSGSAVNVVPRDIMRLRGASSMLVVVQSAGSSRGILVS